MSALLRRHNRYLAALSVVGLLLFAIPTVSGASHPEDPSAAGLARAIAAQESHTPDLLAILGAVGTAVGLGRGSAPVVKVYTIDGSTTGIPRFVDGFPVVVEVVGPITAQPKLCSGSPQLRPDSCTSSIDRTARFDRPVPIGISTGHPAITAGTIGARVTDGTLVYAVSNNHVYADENLAAVGNNVLQPGAFDGGVDPDDAIGTLAAFVPIVFDGVTENRVDAAIALTTVETVGTSTPSDGYGTPASTTVTATPNMEVIKYARTTGQTTGKVDAVNAIVLVGYSTGPALFTGQVIIKSQGGGSFSAGGDSGSLIVTANGNNPVALLFAGNSTITVGNPIDEVLTEFGVYFDSVSPPPTTPTPPGEVGMTGITPSEATSGSTLFGAEIAGSGFAQGASITFSGGSGPTPIATNIARPNESLITLDVVTKNGGLPRIRTWDITVTNPDGAFATKTDALTINP